MVRDFAITATVTLDCLHVCFASEDNLKETLNSDPQKLLAHTRDDAVLHGPGGGLLKGNAQLVLSQTQTRSRQ